MKSLALAFPAILMLASPSTASAAQPEGCGVCYVGMQGLIDFLGTNEGLNYERAFLKDKVCTSPAFQFTQEGCEEGVDAHWENMVNAIVGEEGIGDAVCEEIVSECTGQEREVDPAEPEVRAWDCAACKSRVSQFEDLADNVQLPLELGVFLSGPAYCGAYDDVAVSGTCATFAAGFVSQAWPYIFNDFAEKPAYFCQNVYSLCSGDEGGEPEGGNGSLSVSPLSAALLAGIVAATKLFA